MHYINILTKAFCYIDKLHSNLSSFITDADTYQRVYNVFQKELFISYRKKDRKYARELMNVIHSDERLLGIALWYDDFLIPGEDYNDTITESIQNSDAFLLVVTPNIISEVNYIMTQEYPYAIKNHKHIIPVEFAETDNESLQKGIHYASVFRHNIS